jgi:hypothetical protein
MVKRTLGGRGRGRILVLVLVALALLTLLAVVAQSAFALPGYEGGKHTGFVTSCSSCHPGGSGSALVPNSACTASLCHAGKVAMPTANTTCWSCHEPGKDMATAQTNAGCIGTCHSLRAGTNTTYDTITPHGATPHLGANVVACLNCHTVASALHHAGENAVAPTQCTDCHGNAAVPAANPTPLHGALVAGVTDCTTCHKGMTPTHPLTATVKTPTLAFTATQPTGNPDVTLKGTLKNGTTALAGVLVYLQSTPDGTTFTDVTSVTTTATGAFSYTVVAATAGLQYRAIAQGVAGPPVVLPVKKLVPVTIPVVKETITLKLNGRTTIFTILLGRSVTAKGVIAPKLTLSQVVKLTVQKRRANGTWALVKTLSTVKVTSAYSKIYKPGSRGTFRMRAVLAKTATHTAATSVWRTFKVK